ncbi:MAG: FAD-dependent oxidoreductase [Pyrinomonadaceae bacterium MAG19_C2-C3]|nr:FAD-dependent oxidoreductase [Pyrinomonadaceae bacterium MAG19_C2-C3]
MVEGGKRVAIIERRALGGSCVNFGCTPTKAVVASGRVAAYARRAAEYGLHIPTVEVDFPAVLRRARKLVGETRESLEKRYEGIDNPKLFYGHARLVGKDEADKFRVRFDETTLTAPYVVVGTGTRSLIPKIEGLDKIDFIDAGNWLRAESLPAHLLVIGGGYIGLEMAQFYRRMGARVTIVHQGASVTDREDEDVAAKLQSLLEGEGIEFILNAEANGVVKRDGRIALTVKLKDGEKQVNGSHLFIATGRRPNTDDLGLDGIGVEMDDKGVIKVDEKLKTNIAGVWAMGDVRGGAMFTHTAWDDHRILLSQMTGDGTRTTKRIIPYAIFTDPQVGRVGLTEHEARDEGLDFKTATYQMKSNGKARMIGETEGFIKVIVDKSNDRILGASIIAAEAAEMVHSYVDVMNADAPFTVIRDAVHIHPTFAEAVQSVLKDL